MTNLRRIMAVTIAVTWCVLCYFAVSLMGWSGPTLGWIYAAVAFAPGLLGGAVVWKGRHPWIRLLSAGVIDLGLGLVCWATMPVSHGHIRDMAAGVDLPEGWTVTNTHDYGDGWCMEGCPNVEYDYAATGGASYGDARAEMVDTLHEQGWTGEGDRLSRGRWWAELRRSYGEPEATIAVVFSAG